MNDVLLQLLPVLLAAMLVPVYPIVVLLLLQSQGGLGKAIAFVSGAIIVRLAQGVLFGIVFGAVAQTYPEYGPDIIASTLLLVIGILLLVAAYKKWRKQADPDDPPPRWMAALGGLTAPRALLAGALYVAISVKQWVFTLAAIDIIAGAALGTDASLAAYLLFSLATQSLVLLPILTYAAAPQQSARWLTAAQGWLERNNRTIMVGVSLVFGVYFLFKGVSGLIG
ncbi:MAG: GAP family protein [Caldilineales bacterium]